MQRRLNIIGLSFWDGGSNVYGWHRNSMSYLIGRFNPDFVDTTDVLNVVWWDAWRNDDEGTEAIN